MVSLLSKISGGSFDLSVREVIYLEWINLNKFFLDLIMNID